ncbi:hypothetical protein K2173_010380 [Erythroxylum novogranatense]|uniref:DUF4283 domain-containing protein n=1 Tax=Erythroxylum novogranatense TaxID=1862640 RepID=A0AAV8TF98_9ROSI|nr:hypothetical protein K2173_010380 [Erythroxylum novogranatense]
MELGSWRFQLLWKSVLHRGRLVSPPIEVLQKVAKKLNTAVVGYFMDKRLAYPVVHRWANATSKNQGLVSVTANEDEIFVFKFTLEEMAQKEIDGGPWHIPIFLKKWHPGVKLEKDENMASMKKIWYARVCVKVNLENKMPNTLAIMKLNEEWLRGGHYQGAYMWKSKAKEVKQVWIPKEAKEGKDQGNNSTTPQEDGTNQTQETNVE